jgi:hypothetical protein
MDNICGEQRLINRWKNIKQLKIDNLQCYICDYYGDISNYKILKTNDIFHAGELIRYQCPVCDVIFGDLRFLTLPLYEINNDYSDLYSYYKEGDTTKYVLQCIDKIDIFKDKSKKYLDYACGDWNKVVETLSKQGYDIKGYDKYVNNNNILNNIDNLMFDVIYTNNYFEHIIHPIQDLNKIIEHININGYLILITPCCEYVYEYTH